MNALTKDRLTPRHGGETIGYPVKAATTIYAGSIVALDATGYAVPGATSTAHIVVGVATEQVDNSSGSSGDKSITVRRGMFRFENSASADEIAITEVGDTCYLVDDQTVAKTDGSSTRSRAGIVMDVDAVGVWVLLGAVAANGTALVAANNLSDLASDATARSNLGVYEKMAAPTIAVGAESTNVINVTVQLKDAAGDDLAVRGSVLAYLSDDANGDSIAGTAPDGGVAIGTDGLLIAQVANKAFQLVSEADGDIDIDITESGADTWYLILVMPDGRLVASEAITFS